MRQSRFLFYFAAPLVCLCFIITGCSNHLIYVQETSLGVNLGLGLEGTEKLTIGYDRDVYAIVPRNDETGDAMALLSINKASIQGLNEIKVSEFVAGGEPAEALAKDGDAVAKLREKIYGGDDQ